MNYDKTTPFSQYLKQLIDTKQVDESQIANHFSKYNIYDWLKGKSKPNDQRLLELSDLTKIDIHQLYWMRLKPEERQAVDSSTSLKLVVQLMEYRYLSNYSVKYVAQKIKAQTQTVSNLMRLKTPISNKFVDRFAELYHVKYEDLKKLQVPMGNEVDEVKTSDTKSDNESATKPKNNSTNLTYAQIQKWNHYQPVIQNLKLLIQKHPNLKNLSHIGEICHVERMEILYVDRSQTIKYAKLLASYLDMNLQALLTNGSEMGMNQVYHQARHYANKHKISLTKLENKVGIPYGFIRSCIKNSYFNALTRLATKLPTTVDDLVIKHQLNPKDAVDNPTSKDFKDTTTKPHAISIKHAEDESVASSIAVQSLASKLNQTSQVATNSSFTDAKTESSSSASVQVSNQSFESHVVDQILQNPQLQSLVSLAQSLEKQGTTPKPTPTPVDVPAKQPVEAIDGNHWLKLINQLSDKQKGLLQNILITWLTNN